MHHVREYDACLPSIPSLADLTHCQFFYWWRYFNLHRNDISDSTEALIRYFQAKTLHVKFVPLLMESCPGIATSIAVGKEDSHAKDYFVVAHRIIYISFF